MLQKRLAGFWRRPLALVAGSTANVDNNTFGNPKAPVMIEVFSDFQCPGCKYFHDNEFQRIMTDYVVPGKVYVIYRYFPLQCILTAAPARSTPAPRRA
jgi:protein-disulfide isomerase